ncbi:MAG: AbgT family transporter [bacterium]
MQENRTLMTRSIHFVARMGNKLPHPFMLFSMLAGLVLVLSAVLSALDVSATYVAAVRGSGHPPVEATVYARNLLSTESLRGFLENLVKIYIQFPPLGIAMVMILGVGLIEQTGLMSALMRKTILKAPPYMATVLLAFVGVNANLASGAGVIFTPILGGAVFKAVGRNPWMGVVVGYAAASGGYAANLMVAGTDALLAGITASAIQGTAVRAPVHPLMNWYFMIVATFLVSGVIAAVAERYLGRILDEGEGAVDRSVLAEHLVTPEESRGLRFAGVAALVWVGLLIAALAPANGVLRSASGTIVPESPLTRGLVGILFLIFFSIGIAYGIGSGKITSQRDVPRMMEGGLRGTLAFLTVALPAALFIHFFDESRLSLILAAKGAAILKDLDLGGVPLLVLFVLLVSAMNLFLPSGSVKWLVLSPIFIPMFASVDLSPAMTQLTFRVGDSVTNNISPFKSYLPVIIGLLEQYRSREDREVGIGTVIALQLPFSIALAVSLTLLLVVWYLLGLPLGPGVGVHL